MIKRQIEPIVESASNPPVTFAYSMSKNRLMVTPSDGLPFPLLEILSNGIIGRSLIPDRYRRYFAHDNGIICTYTEAASKG